MIEAGFLRKVKPGGKHINNSVHNISKGCRLAFIEQ
jgi:hypothetical protein